MKLRGAVCIHIAFPGEQEFLLSDRSGCMKINLSEIFGCCYLEDNTMNSGLLANYYHEWCFCICALI